MFTCRRLVSHTARHEEEAIFQRKMSGFRMAEAILKREARKERVLIAKTSSW